MTRKQFTVHETGATPLLTAHHKSTYVETPHKSTRLAISPSTGRAPTCSFYLISRHYERGPMILKRGPMILTSNQSFGSWGEVFGDRIIATALSKRPGLR